MATEVPARELKPAGDCGFNGSGGGARSGSELSHLDLVVSRRQRDMASGGFVAPPDQGRCTLRDYAVILVGPMLLTWESWRVHGQTMPSAGVSSCGRHPLGRPGPREPWCSGLSRQVEVLVPAYLRCGILGLRNVVTICLL